MRSVCRQSFIAGQILVAAGLAGCSGFQSPSVSISEPSVADRSDEAVVLSFDMAMQNPNDQPLELREMHYTLRVDDSTVYRGRRDAQATLPADGAWTISVPAVIPYRAADWSSQSSSAEVRYELQGALLYVMPGEIREILLESGIHRPTVRFRAEGETSLQ